MPSKKKSPAGSKKRRVLTSCGKDVKKQARFRYEHDRYPYTEKFDDKYMDAHDGTPPSGAVYKNAVHKRLSRKGSGSPCAGGKKRTRMTSKAGKAPGSWLTFVAAARDLYEKEYHEKPKPTGLTKAIKELKLWTATTDSKPGHGDMAALKKVISEAKFRKIASK